MRQLWTLGSTLVTSAWQHFSNYMWPESAARRDPELTEAILEQPDTAPQPTLPPITRYNLLPKAINYFFIALASWGKDFAITITFVDQIIRGLIYDQGNMPPDDPRQTDVEHAIKSTIQVLVYLSFAELMATYALRFYHKREVHHTHVVTEAGELAITLPLLANNVFNQDITSFTRTSAIVLIPASIVYAFLGWGLGAAGQFHIRIRAQFNNAACNTLFKVFQPLLLFGLTAKASGFFTPPTITTESSFQNFSLGTASVFAAVGGVRSCFEPGAEQKHYSRSKARKLSIPALLSTASLNFVELMQSLPFMVLILGNENSIDLYQWRYFYIWLLAAGGAAAATKDVFEHYAPALEKTLSRTFRMGENYLEMLKTQVIDVSAQQSQNQQRLKLN